MPELDGAYLSEVLAQVLEEAAFLFVEPADGSPEWGEPVLAASLAFESVQGGTLRLTAPRAVGVELAANMLGLDTEDPEAAQHGLAALSEILNVVGGAFVTRYFGTAVPSQLGLPVPELLPAPPSPPPHALATTVQLESGHPLRLELDLEPVPQ